MNKLYELTEEVLAPLLDEREGGHVTDNQVCGAEVAAST